MVMFDSLNRHMLPPYGCDWVHAPNFQRLAEKTLTFDSSYVCSMPCMPARRDLHTGRPNFLHRSWGPLEPFDDSMPSMLCEAGVSSHLITDHYHYFETGGSTYHAQYATWQFFRGQEGDPHIGQVADPLAIEARGSNALQSPWHRQDRINRQYMQREEDQPQAKTFAAGIDFIRRNQAEDNWFLHLETFDPHEPFFTQRHYQDLYPELIKDRSAPLFDWPKYGTVTEDIELQQQCQGHYASLLSMCDARLGDILDEMDRGQMWEDTMLIVWTDHGFLLGEHDLWAKGQMPWYRELSNTPFFVWDPRCGKAGERRQSLVQPSIDLGPTLLDFFGLEPTADMLGKSLGGVCADDSSVRESAIFGSHGGQVNVTDGRYVYMRGSARSDNQPLYDYTLMPTRMRDMFAVEEFADLELVEPFGFTKECKLMRTVGNTSSPQHEYGNLLFDLAVDPWQASVLDDVDQEERMRNFLCNLMQECEAPDEQYERLGLREKA